MRRRQPTLGVGQRGVALLLVLWAGTVLAILLGGYVVLARTEGLQARYQFAQTQAHYAAEAGIMRAVYQLQDPQVRHRWIGDGRVYAFSWDNAEVKVSAISEAGKVDLNSASPDVLQGLFRATGMAPAAAQALTANVVSWRGLPGSKSQVAEQRAVYAAAGRDYGPRNGPFASIEELQMVLGMTPSIYRQVASAITVWSGNTTPDPDTAPPLALAAIPGMTPQKMQEIKLARQARVDAPGLALYNGVTHSIRSEASLADGTRAVVRATIRSQLGLTGAQPYVVLRWREGDGQ